MYWSSFDSNLKQVSEANESPEEMVKNLILGSSLVLGAAFAQAASFDCSKANSFIEKQICSENQLSEIDSQLSVIYKIKLSEVRDPDVLRAEQREWIKNTRNKCQDASCIKQAYTERLETLKNIEAFPAEVESIQEEKKVFAESENSSKQEIEETKKVDASINSSQEKNTSTIKKDEIVATLTEEKNSESKLGGGLSELFKTLYTFFAILLVLGLFKPKWILRWDSNPSRKKVFAYFFVAATILIPLVEFTKNEKTKAYEAKVRLEREAAREAEIAKSKALEEEKNARLEYERKTIEAAQIARRRAAEAALIEMNRPKPLWERYYKAINAKGFQCDQYRHLIENWRQSGLEENQVNRLASDLFTQATRAGCVQ